MWDAVAFKRNEDTSSGPLEVLRGSSEMRRRIISCVHKKSAERPKGMELGEEGEELEWGEGEKEERGGWGGRKIGGGRGVRGYSWGEETGEGGVQQIGLINV